MLWERRAIAYFGIFLFHFPISFLPPFLLLSLPFFSQKKRFLAVYFIAKKLTQPEWRVFINPDPSILSPRGFYFFLCHCISNQKNRRGERPPMMAAQKLKCCHLRLENNVRSSPAFRPHTTGAAGRQSFAGHPPLTHTVSFLSFRAN